MAGATAMIGSSYVGTLPIGAASLGVEGLKAIVPIAGVSSYYDHRRSYGTVINSYPMAGTDADTLFERALAGDDHELLRRKEAYRQLFRRAFDSAVSSLSVHDRLLIRQHFCDGLTLDEMANLHRVHRATAARQLAKIRDKLFEQTRAVFEAELAVDPREFAELMQLIASQLDASISRLLR